MSNDGSSTTWTTWDICWKTLNEGIESRKKHRLSWRVYVNKGPNYLVHIDGYDKLKRYGFAIHGAICGIHAELCQFREGLNAFGLLDALKEYPTGLETLLCYHTVKMSYEEAKKMIIINFSEEGSNHRKLEVDTAYAFELFLQDCTESASDVNFEELLSFWTGAKSVPPLGFDKKLEINFITGIDRLPVAHTCEMSLELPRGLTPEDMNAKMVKGIRWGGEFHLV